MTTRDLPRTPVPPATPPVPPLRAGDRLTQKEFHPRYEAMPDDVKYELVGGVVYRMIRGLARHSTRLSCASGVVAYYRAHTPALEGGTLGTVILGDTVEPHADVMLRILPSHGGRTRTDENGCPIAGPELIIEIAERTEALDLGPKREDYRRAGVQEYLVLCLDSGVLRGFDLPDDRERGPDADGIWRSRVFPGLWIDAAAALADDAAALLRAAQAGIATPAHAEFVRSLQAARRSS